MWVGVVGCGWFMDLAYNGIRVLVFVSPVTNAVVVASWPTMNVRTHIEYIVTAQFAITILYHY